MRTLTEAHQAHRAAVQHAEPGRVAAAPAGLARQASCVRCGAPLPTRQSGALKTGARYCAASCRLAAVRERRAAARSDLLAALDQLAEVAGRVENALRVLGLNPAKPRTPRHRSTPCPKKP